MENDLIPHGGVIIKVIPVKLLLDLFRLYQVLSEVSSRDTYVQDWTQVLFD